MKLKTIAIGSLVGLSLLWPTDSRSICAGDYCETASVEMLGRCNTRCPTSAGKGTWKTHRCYECGRVYYVHRINCCS